MCNRRLARLREGTILKYSCNEVKFFKEKWLKEFRDENGSDLMKEDKAFDRYEMELENFLSNCKDMPTMSVVEKIIEARELREEGKSPWQKFREQKEIDKANEK